MNDFECVGFDSSKQPPKAEEVLHSVEVPKYVDNRRK